MFESAPTQAFCSINPTTGDVMQLFQPLSGSALDAMVMQAEQRFSTWRHTPVAERAQAILALADELEKTAEHHAQRMTLEMGKPITQSRNEIAKCVGVCRFYAQHAVDWLQPRTVKGSSFAHAETMHAPLGIVLGVMPWNFPYWQVFRFAIPTLLAGNVVIFKHAPNVLQCAAAMHSLAENIPDLDGVFQHAMIGHTQVSQLLQHPGVRGVSLTGSTRAGRQVASQAAEQLKPCVLELGGSDPYIVLDDADVGLAANVCVQSRLFNSGQSCIAAKRWIVVAAHYDAFMQQAEQLMQQAVQGDPQQESTEIGPLAREDLRATLHQQVQSSLLEGATCVCGGDKPTGPGFFYPPTILTDVRPGMTAYTQELFGPVATVIRVQDEQEALHVANDTAFGLGAALFSQDVARAQSLAAQHIDAGNCAINAKVSSDFALPFGGTKCSGFGRELAQEGLYAFTNLKAIVH